MGRAWPTYCLAFGEPGRYESSNRGTPPWMHDSRFRRSPLLFGAMHWADVVLLIGFLIIAGPLLDLDWPIGLFTAIVVGTVWKHARRALGIQATVQAEMRRRGKF